MTKIHAIIKNDRHEVYHIIENIVGMALARDEALSDIKKYIINSYKDYKVEFIKMGYDEDVRF